MRILVIGNGGREHALVWKLAQSPQVTEIFAAPGNGGMKGLASCVPCSATDVEGLLRLAEEKAIDLTVIGPEASLLAGVADAFEERGLAVFGPNRKAAQVEGSKRFAKELMQRYNIPTGSFQSFSDKGQALTYIRRHKAPMVIKADGLAAGKGVIVAHTTEEAENAVNTILDGSFGEAGKEILVEEYLMGQEISLMAFVDGEIVVPMVPAQDHKPVFDGDQGANTGGMGAYSPVPQIPDTVIQQAITDILQPMARGMVQEGLDYRGVLYAGLMITQEGPKVIEFNARFGDPETQVILPRMKTDLIEILTRVSQGDLAEVSIQWREEACVSVVMAVKGYPGAYQVGDPLTLPPDERDRILFHAGTRYHAGKWETAGGRVLGVTALGTDLQTARQKAYQTVEKVGFPQGHYRKDIGVKGLISD
ncbi:phosphoribosylamine--glycine ligase [Kroppenstedtia pulmonis]|uniref:Phosphoribosylamine--glycine ligase n=1 Tax=Kroppenstedtia pulmonis TaxID=1380685 RepID=A0A7D4CDL6_9BACL|nr:phosphoribosylamine--glycine ligase [Kroppenstedtia pulmonis]QKG83474.1 phosphoribosylamine--glycine ligase [Kroppenstedtia pulmonis]